MQICPRTTLDRSASHFNAPRFLLAVLVLLGSAHVQRVAAAAPVDTTAPLISPPTTSPAGNGKVLQEVKVSVADLYDNESALTSKSLLYQAPGQTSWTTVAMTDELFTPFDFNDYYGIVPAGALTQCGTLKYYVRATSAGGTAYQPTGAPSSYFQKTIDGCGTLSMSGSNSLTISICPGSVVASYSIATTCNPASGGSWSISGLPLGWSATPSPSTGPSTSITFSNSGASCCSTATATVMWSDGTCGSSTAASISKPISLAFVDSTPPTISGISTTPASNGQVGLQVKVSVADMYDTCALTSKSLLYQAPGQSSWTTVTMTDELLTPFDFNDYYGIVPAGALTQCGTLKYYVRATSAGGTAYQPTGAPSSYFQKTIDGCGTLSMSGSNSLTISICPGSVVANYSIATTCNPASGGSWSISGLPLGWSATPSPSTGPSTSITFSNSGASCCSTATATVMWSGGTCGSSTAASISKPISLAFVDSTPPTISGISTTPASNGQVGLQVKVSVADMYDTCALTSKSLLYQAPGQSSWTTVTMTDELLTPFDFNDYYGIVPAGALTQCGTLKYYVRATSAGGTAYQPTGAPSSYFQKTIDGCGTLSMSGSNSLTISICPGSVVANYSIATTCNPASGGSWSISGLPLGWSATPSPSTGPSTSITFSNSGASCCSTATATVMWSGGTCGSSAAASISKPISLAFADSTPPIIAGVSSIPTGNAAVGQQVKISIADGYDTCPLTARILYFQAPGSTGWTAVSMVDELATPLDFDDAYGIVPSSALMTDGTLRYFVEAHGAGGVAVLPAGAPAIHFTKAIEPCVGVSTFGLGTQGISGLAPKIGCGGGVASVLNPAFAITLSGAQPNKLAALSYSPCISDLVPGLGLPCPGAFQGNIGGLNYNTIPGALIPNLLYGVDQLLSLQVPNLALLSGLGTVVQADLYGNASISLAQLPPLPPNVHFEFQWFVLDDAGVPIPIDAFADVVQFAICSAFQFTPPNPLSYALWYFVCHDPVGKLAFKLAIKTVLSNISPRLTSTPGLLVQFSP